MAENKVIVIKKYPNRRLYNTQSSKYITLGDLSQIIKQNEDFKVIDVRSNDDVTKIVLTQIILEHETQGYSLLSEEFLKHIIKFYDHPLNSVFSSFMMEALKHFNDGTKDFQPVFNPVDVLEKASDWQNTFKQLTEQNSALINDMFKNFFPAASKKDKK